LRLDSLGSQLGQPIGLWLLGAGKNASPDRRRRLRIHLFRLHAEKEALRLVLRSIIDKSIPISPGSAATDELQRYLLESVRLLKKKTRHGLAQSELLSAAQEFDAEISPGERDTLLTQLARVRGSVKRAVAVVADAGGRIEHAAQVVQIFGGNVMTGDTYNNSGQAGAIGPNAQATGNTFVQSRGVDENVDLAVLAQELGRLRTEMRGKATTAEQDVAVADVAKAEAAATKGDRKAIAEHLKSAGKWALDIASKIGVNLATSVLKGTLGIP